MSYPLRRLMMFPVVMLGVSVFVFVAIRLVPGDAITAMLGTESGLLTPAQRESLTAYFGLDQNWFVQFWRWLSHVLQGDLGTSTTYGKPVMTIILEHFPLTLELAVLSMIIALAIGLPAGIYAATHKDKPADLAVRIIAMIGQSTPGFVVGLLLVFVLSVGFGVLPQMGTFVPLSEDPLRNLSQMILPALTLGTAFAAAVIRISRSAMLDILREDYVRTARSKGMPRRRVIWRHALPNALIPVVTLSGVEFGYLLGGAVLVEQIFALPGLGRVVLDAIQQRDYALVQGSVLFIAVNFMIVNLLVDMAYAALDPRIRFETK
ncbi:MAG: ABC transporter permease [Marinosulfonomonas sp.]